MKTKNYDTRRALLLNLLQEADSEEEYNSTMQELAELANPKLALIGHGITAWIDFYAEDGQ